MKYLQHKGHLNTGFHWFRIALLLLFCQNFESFSQENNWLPIISINKSVEDREKELDSFLLKNKHILSKVQLADFYHDVGNKLYYQSWWKDRNQKNIDSAISLTLKAVELKQNYNAFDTISLARSMYNLGFFHSENHDHFNAIRSYNKMINGVGRTPKAQFAYMELGLANRKVGDYQKAIENYDSFLRVYDGGDNYYLANVHLRLANTYSNMGHTEYQTKIFFHLDKAESFLNTLKEDLSIFYFQLYLLRGNLLQYINKNEEALENYDQALFYTSTLHENHLAVIHNSLGFTYFKQKDFEKAENNLLQSTILNKRYSPPFENLGDLFSTQLKFQEGLLHYQKAIALTTTGNLNGKFDELPTTEELQLSTEKTYLLSHLVAKANAWLDFYKFDGNKDHLSHALATFQRADQLINIIQSQSTEYQSKLYWREQSAKLYMKAVEACHLLEKPDQAYYFMERNKALLLLEDITHEQAKTLSKLPDPIAQREFELKREIHLAENALKNALKVPSDSMQALKIRIFDNKRTHERFMDSVTQSYPDYARLKNRLQVLSFDSFKEQYCSKDQAALQYILNDEQGYGLLNTERETLLFELEGVQNLNEKLVEAHLELNNFSLNKQNLDQYHFLANDLFKKLVPEEVYALIKDKQLIVIPDYNLQKLPFEALVTNAEGPNYLISDSEIRYAYSLSYLNAKAKVNTATDNGLLALAPVEFQALGLANLGFSGLEVQEIQKIYGGELLLHQTATKSKLLENLENYGVVHLSTHADIDDNGNHWVALSDEKLFLNEIYALKNQAEMVVLSACNTSRGELKKGEGVMSLARAFFNSGAKSVVSSLWQVHDKAGKDIVVEFYTGLDKGLTKSAALRRAKLNYLEENQRASLSPSLWASLIIIGDNSPIQNSNFFLDSWGWILAFIVLAFLVFRWRKKNSTRREIRS